MLVVSGENCKQHTHVLTAQRLQNLAAHKHSVWWRSTKYHHSA